MIKKTTLRFLICLLFFLTGMVHLNAQEIEIGEFVKEMNNTLPITTDMCTLTKVTYDAHYVTFHYTLDKMINVDEAGALAQQPSSKAKTYAAFDVPNFKPMLNILRSKNMGFKLHYVGERSQKGYTVTFTAADVRNGVKDAGTHQTPRERLSEIVDATRKVFKNAGKSGKGVDVEDMRLGAYSVCISYLVNEDIYPLVSNQTQTLKQNLIQTYSALTGTDREMVDLIKELNYNLMLIYSTPSKKSFTITISPDELE